MNSHYDPSKMQDMNEEKREINQSLVGDEAQNKNVVFSWSQLSRHLSDVTFHER